MTVRHLIITLFVFLLTGSAAAQEAPTHTVKAGETLYRIATTNGMTVDDLKRLNGLTDNVIHVGQVLRLADEAARDEQETDAAAADEPVVTPTSDDAEPVADEAATDDRPAPEDMPAAVSSYVAQQGETLYSIAADRGSKAYILFTLNNGLREPIEPGTPILVPESRGAFTHTVRRGETLSKIARDYVTTVDALQRANSLRSDQLEVGQTLEIPGLSAADAAATDGRRTYAVGQVTVFPETYVGRVMAGGDSYEPAAFVVAHRELPFDTVLLVENAQTGRSSFARVADRGPLDERRLMEISPAVAEEIEVESGGRVRVRLVE